MPSNDLLWLILGALWFGGLLWALVTSRPEGYTVKGGRMIRWISDWTCKDCGTHNTCPRRGSGLRCKKCKSHRDASVRFWYEQSKLPEKLRRGPGQRPGQGSAPELSGNDD